MNLSMPSIPIPQRVLEIEARFGVATTAASTTADASAFGQALEQAGFQVNDAHSASSVTPSLSLTPAPATSATASFAGSVVNADGTLAADVPYADLFRAAGAAHGIEPSVLAAVAKTESAFDPTAVSPAGAIGLMQFMPGTAGDLGVDPTDPASSIDGAARYLSQNLRQFGSLELALAAYNAGPGSVQRYGGIPPFAETQAYVPKVLAAAGLDQSTGASSS